jgi:hypothetical protein
MPGIAVNVAVIQEGKVLLTKREDFEVWCLPSGGVEDGESLAEAALRETKADAFNGKSGMSVKQEIKTIGQIVADRNELYAVRDQSGLSRQQFYLQRIEGSETEETIEIEDRHS